MSDLAPGDMCVIVDHPNMTAFGRSCVGMTVVLISRCEHYDHLSWGPYWHVSGMPTPKGMHAAVSQRVLRKIPPAPMEEESLNQQERVDG